MPAIDIADHRIGIDLNPVKAHPRGKAGIGQPLRLGGQARRIARHGEQRHAIAIRRRSGGARGDDQQIGDMAMRHELLRAGQLEAVARPFGAHRHRRVMLRPLVDRQRGDRVARQNAGEPAFAHRAALQRRDRRDRSGKERGGRQVAANLLQHHARLDMAEAEAAVALRNQDAGKAHFRKLLPQVARKAGRVIGVAQRAHVRHRGTGGDEILRRVAQHRLFFVQVQGHVVISVMAGSAAPRGQFGSPPLRG